MAKNEGGQPGNKNAQKWTEKRAIALGEELLDWMHESKSNIFFENFLRSKDLYKDATRYLSDKYESFSDLIKGQGNPRR